MYSSGVTLLLSLWKKIKLLTSKYWSSFCSDITFKKNEIQFSKFKSSQVFTVRTIAFQE